MSGKGKREGKERGKREGKREGEKTSTDWITVIGGPDVLGGRVRNEKWTLGWLSYCVFLFDLSSEMAISGLLFLSLCSIFV